MVPYGVCEIENGGILRNIVEKPEYDFFVNTGMYVLDKSILEDIPKNKPYHMTDLINDYLNKGERIGVYPVSEKSWLDMGQFEELQEMLKKFEIKS
jgi:NDP-sugar pyrophosphorylase family protein